MENKSESEKPLKYHQTPNETVIVTSRSYEEVMTDLHIPESYFTPGQRVLSVGEGTSSFARTLREKGVDCIAVDIIYALGNKLFDSKTKIEAEDELNLVSHKRIQYRGDQKMAGVADSINLNQEGPEIDQMVAADTAKLPFPDNTFDVVVADYLTLYVDLEKTIPELIRVLKPGGEIRLGGVGLRILLKHKIIDENFYGNGHNKYFSPACKMSEAFSWLGQQENITVWALLDNYVSGYSKSCDYNGIFRKEIGEVPYSSGTIIIKKDSKDTPVLGRMEYVEELKQERRKSFYYRDCKTLFEKDYPYWGQVVPLDMGVKENIIEREGFFRVKKIRPVIKKEGFLVKDLNQIFRELDQHQREEKEKNLEQHPNT